MTLTPEQSDDETAMDWLYAMLMDLHHRGTALDAVVDSARSSVDHDGRMLVDLDADAWFAAVEAAVTPRPPVPRSLLARIREVS